MKTFTSFQTFVAAVATFILLCCYAYTSHAQNSMTGDGFGGRLWYVAHNYQVGAYSGFTVCDSNNQLYGWGSNKYGELGNGTTIGTATPVAIPDMNHVKFYTTGYLSAAVKENNTAWVWGYNVYGYALDSVPTQVLTNVKFADGGENHVVFVKNDGTVWGVGKNYDGELGNNSTSIFVGSAVQMVNVSNAVRAVAMGENSGASLILLADGTCKLTGGYPVFSSVANIIPAPVPNLSGIVDIKGGSTAAYALNAAGHVYSFGTSDSGSLGTGTIGYQLSTKIIFPAGAAPIVAISANCDGNCALALDENGNVYGWGDNHWGQLGNGTLSNIITPQLIFTNAKDIFAGETFCYILKSDTTLWASGKSGWDSTYGSIWMNLPNIQRDTFTQINPLIAPMNLCTPKPGGVYPIQLLNFSCTAFGSTAKLNWKTGNELNFSRFILEHSKDGRSFETLAVVNAKGSYSSYVYDDRNVTGTAFYRLKMIDRDGTAKYSDIRSVRFGEGLHFTIAPNPAAEVVYVYSKSNTAIQSVQVLSISGQVLKTISNYNSGQGIDVHNLKGGIYLIKTIDKNGVEEFGKVMKM